jgi:hypothetical protein
VPTRAAWTLVLMCWLAGPLAGGGCLRVCPDPAAAASTEACHAAASGFMFTGTHDCGTHFAPANDIVTGTARKDVAPARHLEATVSERVTIAPIDEPRAPADSSPPTTFLTPLRQ